MCTHHPGHARLHGPHDRPICSQHRLVDQALLGREAAVGWECTRDVGRIPAPQRAQGEKMGGRSRCRRCSGARCWESADDSAPRVAQVPAVASCCTLPAGVHRAGLDDLCYSYTYSYTRRQAPGPFRRDTKSGSLPDIFTRSPLQRRTRSPVVLGASVSQHQVAVANPSVVRRASVAAAVGQV